MFLIVPLKGQFAQLDLRGHHEDGNDAIYIESSYKRK
jgi:hypothetical protein